MVYIKGVNITGETVDKHNRDHKKNKRDDKKPVNNNPQFKPEKSSGKKAESKKA